MKTFIYRGLAFVGMMLFALYSFSQDARTVRGKITDSKGESLPSVNVFVEGTTIGTVSNVDGEYQLEVPNPQRAVLVFSFIGYIQQKLPVGNHSTINVALAEETIGLEEVVAIGYGVIKKSDLTGAVGSIKAEELQKTTTANVLQVMQGKVSGLDITQSSGQAGSGVSLNLRGTRSLNASNAPLILVDGIVYGSTLDINPSDIESIEVLKDAASTAIYGTRGANGVILITTKRGGKGFTKVNFNSFLSMNSASNIPKIMTAADFKQKRFETFIADEENSLYNQAGISYNATSGTVSWNQAYQTPWDVFGSVSLEDVMKKRNVDDPNKLLTSDPTALQLLADGVSLDYLDMIFINSVSQNYELGILGGDDRTAINFSLGTMDDRGLLRGDRMRRYNLKLGVDHKVTANIKVGASVLFTNKKFDRRNSSIFNQALKTGPIGTLFNADGTYTDFPDRVFTFNQPNPMLDEVEGSNVHQIFENRIFSSAYINYTPIKGLTIRSNLGTDLFFRKTGVYRSPKSLAQMSANQAVTQMTNYSSWSYTWDNTINYSRLVGEHDVQLLAGSSTTANSNEQYFMQGLGQITPVTEYYDWNGFSSVTSSSSFVASQMQSFFCRINYKLKTVTCFKPHIEPMAHRYWLQGNQWHGFPSASAGWRMSEESFMIGISWLDNLKLRASWGMAGNAAISPYQSYTLVGEKQIYMTLNDVVFSSYAPEQSGNSYLKWETTSTLDLGLDFGFFDNKISGSIDIYESNTDDLLFYTPLPTTSVFPGIMTNLAKSKNRGIEVYVNTQNGRRGKFEWSTDWNFSANRDEIVALRKDAEGNPVTELVHSGNQIWKVGEPLSAYYHHEMVGVYQVETLRLKWNTSKPRQPPGNNRAWKNPDVSNKFYPGDIKLNDLNGDGVFNDDDKIISSRSPKFTFGINNNFSYNSPIGNLAFRS
jgi:TonB-linked SusC/RagA family outer membrane protein